MRMLLLAAAASVSLSGCQTSSIDAAIGQNLPMVCRGATIAHTAFVAYSAVGKISAKDQRREQAAWNVLEPLCVNPSTATSGDVLVAAIRAYAVIAGMLRAAQA